MNARAVLAAHFTSDTLSNSLLCTVITSILGALA